MKLKINFFAIIIFIIHFESIKLKTLYEYYANESITSGLIADENGFHLNGKEITIFSGDFHYFRVHQNDWRPVLTKMRAAGLNAVSN